MRDGGARQGRVLRARTIRASRPTAPESATNSGLTSISRISGHAAAARDIAATACAAAAMSSRERPRAPSSSGAPRSARISRSAVESSTGASATVTSSRISAYTPPSPTRTIAPKRGSRFAPTISSTPSVATIRSTENDCCPSRWTSAANAAASCSSSSMPSTTPPVSDLCVSSPALSTTGYPSSEAAPLASSALPAGRASVIGTPASARKARAAQ